MLKNRLLSILLIILMLFSLIPLRIFASEMVSEGDAKVPVVLTQAATIFSVTVPTVLPVTVDGSGAVTVSTNNRIVNNSFGPIEVKNVEVETLNGWELVEPDFNYSSAKVGLKKFNFEINNVIVNTDGSCIPNFEIINGREVLEFSYDANVSPQYRELNNIQIANVIFTIGWSFADIYYNSLEDALNGENGSLVNTNAKVRVKESGIGTTLYLLEDMPLSKTIVLNTDMIFDFNGHKITSSAGEGIKISGANVTFLGQTDNSGIETMISSSGRSIILYDDATVTINGGTYKGYDSAVYVKKGTVNIKGGFFECESAVEPEAWYNRGDYPYPDYPKCFLADVINCSKDAYIDGIAHVNIFGGTYVNEDPSNVCEGWNINHNWVRNGSVVTETQSNGDIWYIVVSE